MVKPWNPCAKHINLSENWPEHYHQQRTFKCHASIGYSSIYVGFSPKLLVSEGLKPSLKTMNTFHSYYINSNKTKIYQISA